MSKQRFNIGDEVFLVRKDVAYARGLPYTKLEKGEVRKYRITYVSPWDGYDAEMLCKNKTWSKRDYHIYSARDIVPASWLERSLDDYL